MTSINGMKRYRTAFIGCALALLSHSPVFATVFNFSLLNLHSRHYEQVSNEPGHWLAVVLYEPDCQWCLKQIRQLAAAQKRWPCLDVIALGRGPRQQALYWLDKAGTDLPGYALSQTLAQQLVALKYTPTTLWISPDDTVSMVVSGYSTSHQPATPLCKNASSVH